MIRQGNRSLTPQQISDLAYAFSLIKAEDDDLLVNHPSSIFVPTQAYRRVAGKRKCLVVGRKGVGKSAVVQINRKLTESQFSQVIPLQADSLMFERFCNLLAAGREAHAELQVSSDRVANVAWMRSLIFFSALQACEWLLSGRGSPSDGDRELLREAKEILEGELMTEPAADFHGRFHSLVEKALSLLSQISGSLTDSPEERARAKGDQLRKFFAPYPATVDQALSVIARSGFTLLITLDEFDDFVDSYMRTNPMAERKSTLLDLFKGLVLAVKKLNSRPDLRWLHLLIAVPEDKLLELRLRENAAIDQFALEITWSLKELKDCVERRLTHVLGSATAWDDLFGFLVSSKNPTVKAKEQSFHYLVRHTNRKPRELMAYLQAIFESIDSDQKPADERMFQKVVEATTERIVEKQFLPEYGSEYPALEKLLHRLRTAKLRTVMPAEELKHHIRNWKPWDNEEMLNPAETLLRLFQMGVLGLRETCPSETARTIRQNGTNVIYHFSFNGTSISSFHGAIKGLDEQDGQSQPSQLDLVFSPLFFEYLRVQHDKPYIINQVS